jgi:hypothetical protein
VVVTDVPYRLYEDDMGNAAHEAERKT